MFIDTSHSFTSDLKVSARLATFTLFIDIGHSSISGLSDSARVVTLAVRPNNQQMTAMQWWDSKHMSPFLFVNGRATYRKSGFMLAYQAVYGHYFLKLLLLFQKRVALCDSPCYPVTFMSEEFKLQLCQK